MSVVYSGASYDIDNLDGEDYVSQTDYHSNGSVHQYDAINGDWSIGHSHAVYNNGIDHSKGNSSYNRDTNDKDSYGRSWNDRR